MRERKGTNSSSNFLKEIQAALVIRGFVIRGFDCPQPVNCVQNLLSKVISLDYTWILLFCNGKNCTKRQKQWSLVICGFGIRGIILGRNPRE